MQPKELSELVLKVAADEQEYNRYFDYKKLPIPKHFSDMASMAYSHPNAICRICDYYLEHY